MGLLPETIFLPRLQNETGRLTNDSFHGTDQAFRGLYEAGPSTDHPGQRPFETRRGIGEQCQGTHGTVRQTGGLGQGRAHPDQSTDHVFLSERHGFPENSFAGSNLVLASSLLTRGETANSDQQSLPRNSQSPDRRLVKFHALGIDRNYSPTQLIGRGSLQ